MVVPTNVRFEEFVNERLRAYTHRAAQSRNSVVNLAVSEWLAMQQHPLIRFVTAETGERRAALIEGPPVWTIAEAWLAHGVDERDVDAIADTLGLRREAVDAALDYWADYRAEIDGQVQRHHRAQDDALAAWERRQALLRA